MVSLSPDPLPLTPLPGTLLIKQLALRDYGPSQILRELKRKNRYKGRLPVLRTIQRITRELSVDDHSGQWCLKDYDGGSGRLILDVLGTIIPITGGKVRQFTNADANWVLKIRQAAPGLDLWKVWLLTRLYMLREQHNEDATIWMPFWLSHPGDRLLRIPAALTKRTSAT